MTARSRSCSLLLINAANKALDVIDSIECEKNKFYCENCVFSITKIENIGMLDEEVTECMHDILKDNMKKIKGEINEE